MTYIISAFLSILLTWLKNYTCYPMTRTIQTADFYDFAMNPEVMVCHTYQPTYFIKLEGAEYHDTGICPVCQTWCLPTD